MADGGESLLPALRKADIDRYLSVLYAPEEKREALCALYLFNAEIDSIRSRIHDPLPGEVRIQWWRDALAAGRDSVAGHPVATALVQIIEAHGLPLDAFDRYLEARIFDLYDDPMPSRGDLEGYCGETSSALIQLSALILEPEAATTFAAAAGHAGCAQAITGLLRLLPIHRSRGQCYVPADLLAASGTDRDAFLAGNDREAASRVVSAMVALGREHCEKFAGEAKDMPSSLRAAFLPAALAPAYLDRIAARGFDPMSKVAELSAIRKHWALLRRASRGW